MDKVGRESTNPLKTKAPPPMSYLKAYEWGKRQFSKETYINVQPQYRTALTNALLKKFNLINVKVDLATRNHNTGRAWRHRISLPLPHYRCSLGTIYHEVAHVYNQQINNARGHTGTFKTSLIKIYIESRQGIKNIFIGIKKEMEKEKLAGQITAQQEVNKALKKHQLKQEKKNPTYRIEAVKLRIKRLERKQRMITTRLKTARRSLMMLERYQQKKSILKNFFSKEVALGALIPAQYLTKEFTKVK